MKPQGMWAKPATLDLYQLDRLRDLPGAQGRVPGLSQGGPTSGQVPPAVTQWGGAITGVHLARDQGWRRRQDSSGVRASPSDARSSGDLVLPRTVAPGWDGNSQASAAAHYGSLKRNASGSLALKLKSFPSIYYPSRPTTAFLRPWPSLTLLAGDLYPCQRKNLRETLTGGMRTPSGEMGPMHEKQRVSLKDPCVHFIPWIVS